MAECLRCNAGPGRCNCIQNAHLLDKFLSPVPDPYAREYEGTNVCTAMFVGEAAALDAVICPFHADDGSRKETIRQYLEAAFLLAANYADPSEFPKALADVKRRSRRV